MLHETKLAKRYVCPKKFFDTLSSAMQNCFSVGCLFAFVSFRSTKVNHIENWILILAKVFQKLNENTHKINNQKFNL